MRIWLVTPALEWFNEPPPVLADQSLRDNWATYLATAQDAQVSASDVTELLLREVRYLIDSKIDLIKGSDTKASMQVTVLGGGLGVLSILGASESVMITAGVLWLLIPAILLIVAGVVLDLICLMRGYRYTSRMPRIDVYNSRNLLSQRKMRPRVATSLIEGYVSYSNDLTAVSAHKSRLLKVATVLLVVGVAFLIGNAAWADSHPTKPKSNADCSFSGGGVHCILQRK